MTLYELEKLLAQEGEFTFTETEHVLQITLHEFDAKIMCEVPWEQLVDWTKTEALATSIRMWDKLYRLEG